jgi:hypothetical protein
VCKDVREEDRDHKGKGREREGGERRDCRGSDVLGENGEEEVGKSQYT